MGDFMVIYLLDDQDDGGAAACHPYFGIAALRRKGDGALGRRQGVEHFPSSPA